MTATIFKNARVVKSSWLEEGGRRLDCNPYISGAREARAALQELSAPKAELRDLTLGIFDSGRESRSWVDDPRYGVPYMGSSAISLADLSVLPLVSAKQVKRNPRLLVEEGWSLITRSGTVGRMAFVRPDMAGLACSEDVLRVVPDSSRIDPGYLFAFLSSKFGVPLVVSGTYGAIIQHIEPEHIATLPVPRFEGSLETAVGELVRDAARRITAACKLLNSATSALLSSAGLEDLRDHQWKMDPSAQGWGEHQVSPESLRAIHYDPRISKVRSDIESRSHSKLGTICDPEQFKGKIIFTRVDADPDHSVMLLGQRSAFHLRPEGRWIAKRSIEGLGLMLPPGATLIPSHGTLGEFELYCRAVIVTKRTARYAYSGDFFRCVPVEDLVDPGYLFAFMRSRLAFRMLRSISTGSKQQEQHSAMMARLPIPRLRREIEKEIAEMVDAACSLHDTALENEDRARAMVEGKIIDGGA